MAKTWHPLKPVTGKFQYVYSSLHLNVSDFVLSFAMNGELLSYIEANNYLPLKCAKFYSAELVLALEYLFEIQIIHRYTFQYFYISSMFLVCCF